MSAGFFTLLRQITIMAKSAAVTVDDIAGAAAKVSVQSTALVIDDTAVTPHYVDGLEPKREIPIIWKITVGSFRNKLIFILPAIVVLNIFAPWVFPVFLTIGGIYLSLEGAKAILEKMNISKEQTDGSPRLANKKIM